MVLQQTPLPLVADQRAAEVIPLGHPDQRKLRIEYQAELLRLAQEAERVGRCRGCEYLVGDG